MELDKIKQNISIALKWLGLEKEVSLKEIEEEILEVETAFQPLLILGILRRIMARDDKESAELFIPAISQWKDYLPDKELEGLSPIEYQAKYPPGRYETPFIANYLKNINKDWKKISGLIR